MNRKKVFKIFWVWDFEKEENWLNEMALNGWMLDNVGFCSFGFVACEPGEYTLRLENHAYDSNYIDFMAETGAEYVGRVFTWMYFRKRSEYGEFNLFSDIDSRIAHLDRIGKTLTGVGIFNLIIGLNLSNHLSWLNLLCATFLMYGLGRIHGKKEALEKERSMHE